MPTLPKNPVPWAHAANYTVSVAPRRTKVNIARKRPRVNAICLFCSGPEYARANDLRGSLASYLVMADGDKGRAILLYERNVVLSEGLYGILHALEVSSRNSIHRVMGTATHQPDWYDHLNLENIDNASVVDAKKQIVSRGKAITHSRVVAQLTFGFWVRLLSTTYEKNVWVKHHLARAFPALFKASRSKVYDRYYGIKNLRNQVAHQERILGIRNIGDDYRNILETIGWICPTTAAWVNSHNSLQKSLYR